MSAYISRASGSCGLGETLVDPCSRFILIRGNLNRSLTELSRDAMQIQRNPVRLVASVDPLLLPDTQRHRVDRPHTPPPPSPLVPLAPGVMAHLQYASLIGLRECLCSFNLGISRLRVSYLLGP